MRRPRNADLSPAAMHEQSHVRRRRMRSASRRLVRPAVRSASVHPQFRRGGVICLHAWQGRRRLHDLDRTTARAAAPMAWYATPRAPLARRAPGSARNLRLRRRRRPARSKWDCPIRVARSYMFFTAAWANVISSRFLRRLIETRIAVADGDGDRAAVLRHVDLSVRSRCGSSERRGVAEIRDRIPRELRTRSEDPVESVRRRSATPRRSSQPLGIGALPVARRCVHSARNAGVDRRDDGRAHVGCRDERAKVARR